MPLTSSHKIDRDALAALTLVETTETRPPEGPVEIALARTWQSLLPARNQGGRSVGRDDNFYNLGGHSLIALRVLSFIHRVLDVPISLPELLHAPTVAAVAAAVERGGPTPDEVRRRAEAWLRTDPSREPA